MMGTKTNPTTGARESSTRCTSVGRKITLYIMTVAMVAAIVLEMVASEWKLFLAGKIVSGIATGINLACLTATVAELAMPQMRGTCMGAFGLGFSLGQLPCAIGLEVLNQTAPHAFRRIFYAQFVLVGVWLPVLFLIPESPVWLASKGRHDDGRKALAYLVGKVDGYDVGHEYAVIVAEYEHSRAVNAGSWAAIFRGTNLKRTLATSITPALQYFIGQPLIYGQTTYFFQTAGLANPFIGNLILTVLTVVAVAVGNFFILDHVPRRRTLLIATAVSIVLQLIMGGLGCIPPTGKSTAALIALCSLWVVTYATTIGPIFWMTLGEIPTPALRQRTITFALIHMNCWGCMFTYIIPLLLSPQKAGLGTKTTFVFAAVSAPFIPLMYYFLPETKHRSSAAVDELYERGISPCKFVQTKTAAEGYEEDDVA
jgi:hypothetical protein